MQKTILVTGAGGLLGREILNQLCSLNSYNVFALTSNRSKLSKLFSNEPNIKILGHEELDNKQVPFNEIDVVMHCAFARSNNGYELAESLNFSQRIFTESIKSNCSIINISSRSVYGQNPNTPWMETTKVEPNSLYALAKYSSEIMLQGIVESYNNRGYTNIRLAGLISPEISDRVVNKFIDSTLKGKSICIIGGKQQFAYLDARDAASGIIFLLQAAPQTWQPIYNLGHLKSYSIKEIAEAVAKVAGKFNCPEVKINIEKTDEALYAEMDSTLFYTDTNWQPNYDMDMIVESIFADKLQ